MSRPHCIIVHGCPSNREKAMDPEMRTYDKHWMPWAKQQLIAYGIPTETPLMPSPWDPDYDRFKEEFEKYAVDEDTVLVGHSCGCAFLVRWLGETKKTVRKLILVAPWKVSKGNRMPAPDPFRENFYGFLIDPTIPSRVKDIIIFTSDDEVEDGKKSVKMYSEVLGGKIVELMGRGHYCLADMGTEEFPELIDAVVE